MYTYTYIHIYINTIYIYMYTCIWVCPRQSPWWPYSLAGHTVANIQSPYYQDKMLLCDKCRIILLASAGLHLSKAAGAKRLCSRFIFPQMKIHIQVASWKLSEWLFPPKYEIAWLYILISQTWINFYTDTRDNTRYFLLSTQLLESKERKKESYTTRGFPGSKGVW